MFACACACARVFGLASYKYSPFVWFPANQTAMSRGFDECLYIVTLLMAAAFGMFYATWLLARVPPAEIEQRFYIHYSQLLVANDNVPLLVQPWFLDAYMLYWGRGPAHETYCVYTYDRTIPQHSHHYDESMISVCYPRVGME
jgi:hypothetical protein